MLTQTLVSSTSKKHKLLCSSKKPLNDRHWLHCDDLYALHTQSNLSISRPLQIVSS